VRAISFDAAANVRHQSVNLLLAERILERGIPPLAIEMTLASSASGSFGPPGREGLETFMLFPPPEPPPS